MQIADEHIARFQSLYMARFGKAISAEEALEQGTMLLRLIHLTYKPMTVSQLERESARRREIT